MKINIKHVPLVINGLLYGGLALSLGLIVADYNLPGAAVALVVFVLHRSLKSIRVKAWVIEKLTGLPRVAVLQFDQQRKQEARIRADTQAAQLPAEQIDQLLAQEERPGVLLKRHWPPDAPAPQNSWLGGLPKLPAGTAWPHNPETGLALHHLAQIDLSEMPLPATGPQLPRHGVLNFFADIEEEMVWDHGAETGHSAVIFSEDGTAHLDVTPAPETLPEVDHSGAGLTSHAWGFRPPRFKTYARWPVAGLAAPTWPQDALPQGVDYRSGYPDALTARLARLRADLLGSPPDRKPRAQMISRKTVETPAADGTARTELKTIVDLDAFGPGFPFNATVAREYLRGVAHVVGCDVDRARGDIDRAGKAEKEPSEFALAQFAAGSDLLPRIEDLLARAEALQADAPLDASVRDAIRAIIVEASDNATASNWLDGNAQRRAILRAVARGWDEPAARAGLPPEALAAVADVAHPAHEYTNHYLLGAKGAASNPTAGQGVRLLQIDSDYALEFMFCDCGIIDFWIAPEDLEAGRWDRAWAATAGG